MTSHLQQPIEIPLPEAAHRWAQMFASKQLDVPSGKQVYYNTLSVFAVDEYLQQLGIATDLQGSDSWYPGLTSRPDAADLKLPNIGKIECRPIFAEDVRLQLPESIPSSNIGYIAVQLNDALDTAVLVGYSPILKDDLERSIDFDELKPMADLANYLGKIRDGYSVFDTQADSEIITTLLSQIDTYLLSSFIAKSVSIHENKSISSIGKRIQIQTLLNSTSLAGSQRTTGHHLSDEIVNQENHIRSLSTAWLEILNGVWEQGTPDVS
jgi:Protein of unknown function (DUF1822)